MNRKVIHRVANGDTTAGVYEEQVRFLLDTELLNSMESQTPLGSVFDMFRAGLFEEETDLTNDLHKLPPAFREHVTIVDISADNPTTWFYTHHSVQSAFQNCTGLPLSSLKSRINRDAILVEYMIAKEYVQPLYYEIHQWQDEISRHYARLIVPVLSEGHPNRLLICSRHLPTTVVPVSSAMQLPLLATDFCMHPRFATKLNLPFKRGQCFGEC